MNAFVQGAALPLRGSSIGNSSLKCPPAAPVGSQITMGSRRDLKREKQIRNMEFARAHRKKVARRFNRRAISNQTQDEDNAYLSAIFGTIRFGGPPPEDDNRDRNDKNVKNVKNDRSDRN